MAERIRFVDMKTESTTGKAKKSREKLVKSVVAEVEVTMLDQKQVREALKSAVYYMKSAKECPYEEYIKIIELLRLISFTAAGY